MVCVHRVDPQSWPGALHVDPHPVCHVDDLFKAGVVALDAHPTMPSVFFSFAPTTQGKECVCVRGREREKKEVERRGLLLASSMDHSHALLQVWPRCETQGMG